MMRESRTHNAACHAPLPLHGLDSWFRNQQAG
jgi:hypothetical protein